MTGLMCVGGLSRDPPAVLGSKAVSSYFRWMGERREPRGDLLRAFALITFGSSTTEPLSHSATELCPLLTFFLELMKALSAGFFIPYGSPMYGSLIDILAVLTDSMLLFTGSHGLIRAPIGPVLLLVFVFLAR